MTTKKEIADFINATNETNLNRANTSYSKINKSKEVWWFNVPVHKFTDDVHLLLDTTTFVIWIHLPKNFVYNLSTYFKIRPDRDAVDLEISSDRKYKYLIDVKSGGTEFDFKEFVKEKIVY